MPQGRFERGFWAAVRGGGTGSFNPYPPEHWRPKKEKKVKKKLKSEKERERKNGIIKVFLKPNSNKAVKIFYDNGIYRAYYGQNIEHEFQLLGVGKDFKTFSGAKNFAFQKLELKNKIVKIPDIGKQLTFFD